MVQGKWPRAIESASGELDDPSLLFFRKADGSQDSWNLIGMGYSFEITKDGQDPPATMPDVPSDGCFIHEVGYHHSPGDGGFTCACNDDLKGDVPASGLIPLVARRSAIPMSRHANSMSTRSTAATGRPMFGSSPLPCGPPLLRPILGADRPRTP
jgi:hypothetical protein